MNLNFRIAAKQKNAKDHVDTNPSIKKKRQSLLNPVDIANNKINFSFNLNLAQANNKLPEFKLSQSSSAELSLSAEYNESLLTRDRATWLKEEEAKHAVWLLDSAVEANNFTVFIPIHEEIHLSVSLNLAPGILGVPATNHEGSRCSVWLALDYPSKQIPDDAAKKRELKILKLPNAKIYAGKYIEVENGGYGTDPVYLVLWYKIKHD